MPGNSKALKDTKGAELDRWDTGPALHQQNYCLLLESAVVTKRVLTEEQHRRLQCWYSNDH